MSSEAQFPTISSPFVDENRMVSLPWRALLTTLWNRTGGSEGAILPGGVLIAANNLSDLTSGIDARNNLGLGAAAEQPLSTFLLSADAVGGWFTPTGTGSRASVNMNFPMPVGATYSQSEVTDIATQVTALQKALGQLIIDLIAVKAIGT